MKGALSVVPIIHPDPALSNDRKHPLQSPYPSSSHLSHPTRNESSDKPREKEKKEITSITKPGDLL
jgi:hypothetical protein